MQHILLLFVIYLSFISLGIPDAVLGAAWPVMHKTLNVSLSFAGIITMIISAGTIISSLFSDKVISKYGVSKTTAYSTAITAMALFGFSLSSNFWHLCILAIPYGLGAGSIDAALNNYVAINYKAKHMNWLHCCWGIGAAAGPIIIGQVLAYNLGWKVGYLTIAILQTILVLILFSSIKLWKKSDEKNEEIEISNKTKKEIVSIKGVKEVLVAFFCYCALETSAGLWAASYMVSYCNFEVEKAATFAAMFYIGITVGRFLSGFISIKLSDKKMILYGECLIILGIILLILSNNSLLTIVGLCLVGFGCSPIYPAFIHSTPNNWGKDVSQSIIGMQMASAYVGTTFMPPFFGLLQKYVGLGSYPIFLSVFAVMMIFYTLKMNKLVD